MQKTPRGTIIYEKGENIIKEGETGKSIYFLISGKIGVYKGENLVGTIDKPNSPIGEISAILGTKRTATCVALEKSEVVAYNGGIDEIVTKYPKTAKAIIVNLAERVAKSTERLSGVDEKTKEEPKKTENKTETHQANGNVFSQISELPPEKISKFLTAFSEKELAVILANIDKNSKDKISKFISSRKMEALEDLISYYTKNALSSAEMEVLKDKISDIISAFKEESR
ncbi:MAG: Crp/Fnr family transcriptional regulator [Candidatus Calescibacterium sp.]|nr:Crp/Fnr family transcriptional regulator [Candidatus Calescibacterium sp.]MCX7733203.1 Crp/Fnr family transcriptional regulator [bacterium]MDW8086910.1 Crp/Fnr family transcriptional regulator [Candidatus Calescibacterium sp.]